MLALIWAVPGLSQVKFVPDAGTEFVISGTSTVHDWTCKGSEVTGFANLPKDWVDGKPKVASSFSGVEVSVLVRGLLSGRGSIMDDKMYAALKDDEHPNIEFKVTKATIKSVTGNKATLEVTGTLSMAGVTKTITMPITGERVDGTKFKFAGEKALKMTDFGMEPPTALFGALLTGDDVKVSFNLTMKKA